jgi:1-acyl-sn-glycerol-3-phosphate acyltransferase
MPDRPPGWKERVVVTDELAETVLATVRGVVEEIHPGAQVRLDSLLDRDLGLDSLALVELLGRLEEAVGVSLPDGLLTDAQTPRDLLRSIPVAGPHRATLLPATGAHPATLLPATMPIQHEPGAPPAGTATLVEALDWHAADRPDALHVRLLHASGPIEEITYGDLQGTARATARGLREHGVVRGDAVALMLPTGREYFEAFLGILAAGGVPVPIYPPWRPSQIEEHLLRQAGILDNAQARLLITVPEARPAARLLALRVPGLRRLLTPAELTAAEPAQAETPLSERDTALMQYTSGSTGAPKGVVLTHANLLANIRAMGEAMEVTPADVFVSWLPLYHDMGLIGAWLASLYFGMVLVLMPPTDFLRRPVRWLRAIHEHRGTISASPNFGFELCLRRVGEEEAAGLDLSSWRIAFNGAEPVSPDTVRRFTERFGPSGFRAETMTPVYGLAEASVGLTFPPLGRGPVIDRIAREPSLRSGRALPAPEADPHPLRMVACGRALPRHEVRIVDAGGRPVDERQEGRIEFRGPSATSGYHRNPHATRRLFRDGWLDTGDLGYWAAGDLYVTGREKDVVIRAGRNLHPQELEEAVGAVDGIRSGRTAVFGARDPSAGTERLVVLAETREQGPERRDHIRRDVVSVCVDLLGTPPDDIVLAPPGTVLKTSSGKVRRAACRELYELGKVGAGPGAVWTQVVRLTASAVGVRLRRVPRAVLHSAYATYAWALVALLGPPVWFLVIGSRDAGRRWAVLRGGARLLFLMSGTRLAVEERSNIPDGGCVVVANHSSPLDGLALSAVLPGPLVFVAAGEFAPRVVTGTFLRSIGAEFVERMDRAKAAAAPDRLVAAARRGSVLVFFPEGRMSRAPGLQPFRMGAFAVASEVGVPVVPVGILGTTAMLPADGLRPRPGRIRVVIGDPINPRHRGWAAAVELRNAARAALVRCLHDGDPGGRQEPPARSPGRPSRDRRGRGRTPAGRSRGRKRAG